MLESVLQLLLQGGKDCLVVSLMLVSKIRFLIRYRFVVGGAKVFKLGQLRTKALKSLLLAKRHLFFENLLGLLLLDLGDHLLAEDALDFGLLRPVKLVEGSSLPTHL